MATLIEMWPNAAHRVLQSDTSGKIEAMALYAGYSVERIPSVEFGAGIMRELVDFGDS